MRVDGNISDLFFNTEHHVDADGEYAEMAQEAKDFLDCLEHLNVPVPTVDELIADFNGRL